MRALLLVAHPDDDAIFAGALQRRLSGHTWSVVCLTGGAGAPRGRELLRWQASLGTPARRIHFLGETDDPRDLRDGTCSIPLARVCRRIAGLGLAPDVVVTHNAAGEYGHPHHVLAHRAAARVFPATPRLEFARGATPADLRLRCAGKWPRVAACYRSQWRVVARHWRPSEGFRWATGDGEAGQRGKTTLVSFTACLSNTPSTT
ncbi:MAG: PIG-L deacetylase family protein [Myxococcota bacterium]